MTLLGKIVSLPAMFFYRHEWSKLERALQVVHSKEHFVPDVVQHVLILAEDHRFFLHQGVDVISICRAIWRRVGKRVIEGGSTLEQQFVRVLTGRYERTLRRKVREICLATLVTRVIPKGEIPALYLSIAYFGWHMNGFTEACSRLGFNYQQLGVQEAAEIVARLKYPQPKVVSDRRAESIQRRRIYLAALYYRSRLTAAEPMPILEPTHGTFSIIRARTQTESRISAP